MPDLLFKGDPYRVLDVDRRASAPTIKRRWRDLAREHHPDRVAGDREAAARLTSRMARINAAYDLLRDPVRRARYDSSAEGWRAAAADGDRRDGWADAQDQADDKRRSGPPPPPPTRPVTARYDTTAAFRPRNATISGRTSYSGQPPISRRARAADREDLRASTPTGPVHRHRTARPEPVPSIREARETELGFGKFRGYTLGEVELLEPAYVDWIAQTITRDRDLVAKARVIQAELDRMGTGRRTRPAAQGFGSGPAAG